MKDRFAAAIEQGFMRAPRDSELWNYWYDWCKRHRFPLVQVKKDGRHGVVTVNLDTISCGEDMALSASGTRRIGMLLRSAALPRKAPDGPSRRLVPGTSLYDQVILNLYGAGTDTPKPWRSIWCDRIPDDRADALAAEVARIAREEMQPYSHRDALTAAN